MHCAFFSITFVTRTKISAGSGFYSWVSNHFFVIVNSIHSFRDPCCDRAEGQFDWPAYSCTKDWRSFFHICVMRSRHQQRSLETAEMLHESIFGNCLSRVHNDQHSRLKVCCNALTLLLYYMGSLYPHISSGTVFLWVTPSCSLAIVEDWLNFPKENNILVRGLIA